MEHCKRFSRYRARIADIKEQPQSRLRSAKISQFERNLVKCALFNIFYMATNSAEMR
jgi:hypothetical protein